MKMEVLLLFSTEMPWRRAINLMLLNFFWRGCWVITYLARSGKWQWCAFSGWAATVDRSWTGRCAIFLTAQAPKSNASREKEIGKVMEKFFSGDIIKKLNHKENRKRFFYSFNFVDAWDFVPPLPTPPADGLCRKHTFGRHAVALWKVAIG